MFNRLVSIVVGLVLGLGIGGVGMAVAKDATNPVPAWQNVVCSSSQTSDCYNVDRRSYIHFSRHLNRSGVPNGTVKCEFFVGRLNQRNDYCRKVKS